MSGFEIGVIAVTMVGLGAYSYYAGVASGRAQARRTIHLLSLLGSSQTVGHVLAQHRVKYVHVNRATPLGAVLLGCACGEIGPGGPESYARHVLLIYESLRAQAVADEEGTQ